MTIQNVLVTGSGGLVGSHVVPLLARGGRRVFALGRSMPEGGGNVVPVAADLSRPLDIAALPERIDAVVYLAQSARYREFPDGAADMFQLNVAQPLALLDYARGAGATHFVYASSGSVYAPSPQPIGEDAPTPAAGFYASSKRSAELLVRNYAGLLSVTALRFFFIYGRGQKGDMLIPRLVGSVREGRTVTLQGGEGMRLKPTHADDAARAVEAALALEGSHTINVAGPEATSIRAICETAGRALGRAPVFAEDAGAQAPDFLPDIGLMERLLGAPQVGFEEGVRDLL